MDYIGNKEYWDEKLMNRSDITYVVKGGLIVNDATMEDVILQVTSSFYL